MNSWLPKLNIIDMGTVFTIINSINLLSIKEYIAVLIFGSINLLFLVVIKYFKLDI